MLAPNQISSGVAPRKRTASSFARVTISLIASPVGYCAPRLPDAVRSAAAIAFPTSSGTCVPPGASKNAKPFSDE